MKKVFAVYKTDSWHSYASRDLIGIATTEVRARNLCKKDARKRGVPINIDQGWNLRNLKQTQRYAGDGEYQYEGIETNVLL